MQGVTIEKMVVLQASNTLTRFAANQILRDVPLKNPWQGSLVELEAEITSIEYGTITIGPTIFVNAALLTEFGDVDRKPIHLAISV